METQLVSSLRTTADTEQQGLRRLAAVSPDNGVD